MSSSKATAELCTLLVDATYGELTSRIFALLLRRGRLSVPLLAQHSRLTPRQLRHGLVVLIQQNLVYHNLDGNDVTYYEANADAAYALVRSGKILEVITARYGPAAGDVVQNLFLLGHAKVADLREAYKSKTASKAKPNGSRNGANGHLGDEVLSLGQLDRILVQLLEKSLIEPVNATMFRSPADTFAQVEKEALRSAFGGSTKGSKQKDELNVMVASKLRKLRPEERDWRQTNGQTNGLKRSLNAAPNGSEKRRKMMNGEAKLNGSNYGHDEETILDVSVGLQDSTDHQPNLVVRVNYEKCTVVLRSQRLVALAAERIGETTASIYGEFLSALEDDIPRCRPDPSIDGPREDLSDKTISTMTLSNILNPSIDPSIGIGKTKDDQIDLSSLEKTKKKRKPVDDDEAVVVGDASSDEEEDDSVQVNTKAAPESSDQEEYGSGKTTRKPRVTFEDELPPPSSDSRNRMAQLKKHLFLLSEDRRKLLRHCGNQGLGEWTVDFEAIIEGLRLQELDTIVMQRFGKVGLRLVRILREYGKLDEKQLPNIGLLKQRDVRTKLIEMQMAGFVDIQEVPRDSNRTPSRTMFFWYFDEERVSAIVLDSVYKAMARCLQTLEVEKHKDSDIIALAERSDVRGQEEEMLSAEQMNRLRIIRDKEERLHGLVFRLDELVGIFKDY